MTGGFVRTVAEVAATLPLPANAKWPGGVWDIEVLERHGTSILFFAPRESDHQTPHTRDEIYVVARGSATLTMADEGRAVAVGDMIFVPALAEHRFSEMRDGFATWVVFFGPRADQATLSST
jgi:mannose-6-phosphate isomerase-like protein (cupin superfamily)